MQSNLWPRTANCESLVTFNLNQTWNHASEWNRWFGNQSNLISMYQHYYTCDLKVSLNYIKEAEPSLKHCGCLLMQNAATPHKYDESKVIISSTRRYWSVRCTICSQIQNGARTLLKASSQSFVCKQIQILMKIPLIKFCSFFKRTSKSTHSTDSCLQAKQVGSKQRCNITSNTHCPSNEIYNVIWPNHWITFCKIILFIKL